jgi:hypothetical protein
LLDDCLHYALDFDFFVRLSARGYRFLHIRELLADFRLHNASKTCSMPERQLHEVNDIMRRHSPVTSCVEDGFLQSVILKTLCLTAGALRCSQKLLTGCYLPGAVLGQGIWNRPTPPHQ